MLYLNSIKNGNIRKLHTWKILKLHECKTRKNVGKRVRPHPFSRQNFAISLANIYVWICFSAEFQGIGYETLQTLMAITKELQFMLNCTCTWPLRIFCFWNTLWLNYVMETFLLGSCSNKSSKSIVVLRGQGQETITKHRIKTFLRFHNHCALIY